MGYIDGDYEGDDERHHNSDVEEMWDVNSDIEVTCVEAQCWTPPVAKSAWREQRTVCAHYYHRTGAIRSLNFDCKGCDYMDSEQERRMCPKFITEELDGVINLVSDSDNNGMGFESGSCTSDGYNNHERNQFWTHYNVHEEGMDNR